MLLTSYLSECVYVGNAFSDLWCHWCALGFVLGPILFYLYILPITHIVLECGVSLQQYADDTQLDISCSVSDSGSALSTLKSCLAAAFLVLSQWSSSEPWQIWGNNICHLPTPQLFPRPFVIHILSSSVPISDYITTLGVIQDSNLTLNKHVSSVCKSAYYSIKTLRHIRPVLTCDMARAVAASLT